MTRRAYVLLFLLGLAMALGLAAFQTAPGYMDADYYYATGKQLAAGQGFVEPFLWNYLDDPAGLPHPSHLYWMPLAAMLAAAGMWVSGVHSFLTARLGFLLLSACLPPVTAWLAFSFGGNRKQALIAGLLGLFPGFYLPFLTTTDTFGIYMMLGVLFLEASRRAVQESAESVKVVSVLKWCALTGMLAGLMHLTRADGVIWMFMGLATAWAASGRLPVSGKGVASGLAARRLGSLAALVMGYLLVTSPWIARNLHLAGSISAPGAARALWITNYDELFIYPAELLTPARWWASGIGELLGARLWALGQNLQTALAVQGEVFLVPLVLAGLWRFRRDPRVRFGGLAWVLTFLVMTAVFPFQGARGGWFHSGAAVQPLFWALAPAGLQVLVEWGEQRRGWVSGQGLAILGSGLVALAVLVTFVTVYSRMNGAATAVPPWGQAEAVYARVEQALHEVGAPPGATVLVNNPPGYFGATGRPALVIPDGDEAATLAVARRYQAAYLLLEPNHPRALEDLYRNPGDRPGLDFLLTVDGVHIFHIGDER